MISSEWGVVSGQVEGRIGGDGGDAILGEKQGRVGEVFDYCLGLRILSRGGRGGA